MCIRDRREAKVSHDDSTQESGNKEKWDDVDLTVVQDDFCRSVITALTTNNEHCNHIGDQESDVSEELNESKLASAKDTHQSHNGLALDTSVHSKDSINNEKEEEEGEPQISQTRSNGVSDTRDAEETSSHIPDSLNSTSNERLKDLDDSDSNLSLSELLHVLQKEYKNKRDQCFSTSCHTSDTNETCRVHSDATQTDGEVTLSEKREASSSRLVVKSEEEEKDENIEIRRAQFRRCSSLKSGKTPPGTPGHKKIVRFADVLGLDLSLIHI